MSLFRFVGWISFHWFLGVVETGLFSVRLKQEKLKEENLFIFVRLDVLCVWHLVRGQSILEEVESSLISAKSCESPLYYSALAFFWSDPWACGRLAGVFLKWKISILTRVVHLQPGTTKPWHQIVPPERPSSRADIKKSPTLLGPTNLPCGKLQSQ